MSGEYVPAGRIVRTFGYKGHLKVLLNNPSRHSIPEAFFISKSGSMVPFFVESMVPNLGGATLKLEGIESKEEALKLTGREIFLPASEADGPAFEEGKFTFLTGYELWGQQEGRLGEIEEVFILPMQEIARLTIKGKEVLVPLNDAVIRKIDSEARTVHIDIPVGLIEAY